MELYQDSGEEIQRELSFEKGTRTSIILYVDTDHTHDLFTKTLSK
jgi:hypothetical protein